MWILIFLSKFRQALGRWRWICGLRLLTENAAWRLLSFTMFKAPEEYREGHNNAPRMECPHPPHLGESRRAEKAWINTTQ